MANETEATVPPADQATQESIASELPVDSSGEFSSTDEAPPVESTASGEVPPSAAGVVETTTDSPVSSDTGESTTPPDLDEQIRQAEERLKPKRGRAASTETTPVIKIVRKKAATEEIPDKFKNGKKRKKGQRPTHYLQDALALATPEDKKVVKEYYTDYIAKHVPRIANSPLMPAFEALALHAYMHGKSMADPPWWMSAGVAAIPLAMAVVADVGEKATGQTGPKPVAPTQEQREARMTQIRAIPCPKCGAASGESCFNPEKPDEKAPPDRFHQERVTATAAK